MAPGWNGAPVALPTWVYGPEISQDPVGTTVSCSTTWSHLGEAFGSNPPGVNPDGAGETAGDVSTESPMPWGPRFPKGLSLHSGSWVSGASKAPRTARSPVSHHPLCCCCSPHALHSSHGSDRLTNLHSTRTSAGCSPYITPPLQPQGTRAKESGLGSERSHSNREEMEETKSKRLVLGLLSRQNSEHLPDVGSPGPTRQFPGGKEGVLDCNNPWLHLVQAV